MTSPNAFGIYLRAARLGFHYCDPVQAYVRIEVDAEFEKIGESEILGKTAAYGRFVISSRFRIYAARTIDDFKMVDPTSKAYVVWWEADPIDVISVGDHHGMTLWSLCRGLREMSIPGTIVVNDDGEKIGD